MFLLRYSDSSCCCWYCMCTSFGESNDDDGDRPNNETKQEIYVLFGASGELVGPQYDVDVVDDLGIDQLCACSLVAAGKFVKR